MTVSLFSCASTFIFYFKNVNVTNNFAYCFEKDFSVYRFDIKRFLKKTPSPMTLKTCNSALPRNEPISNPRSKNRSMYSFSSKRQCIKHYRSTFLLKDTHYIYNCQCLRQHLPSTKLNISPKLHLIHFWEFMVNLRRYYLKNNAVHFK